MEFDSEGDETASLMSRSQSNVAKSVPYRCLYLSPTLSDGALIDEPRLAATSERHKLAVHTPKLEAVSDPLKALERDPSIVGAVIEMWLGWPSFRQLRFATATLKRQRRVWMYWPKEQAVECVDRERVRSGWRHWLLASALMLVARPARRFAATANAPNSIVRRLLGGKLPGEWRITTRSLRSIAALRNRAAPVSFTQQLPPTATSPVQGIGIYLRLDFWVPLTSGGSYGHTCYVAKELAAVTQRFQCLMVNRFSLLDDLGIPQHVLPLMSKEAGENVIVEASRYYYPILRQQLEPLQPSYIYERLVLGNYAGALISQELGIPYIVEYNGSEISMRHSFDKSRYIHEDVYLKAEMLAFEQATLISVISTEVKSSLVARGIPAEKILVNPNGADLDAYAPATPDERATIRRELGFNDIDPVVGFTGTFGGWHGVDVLAEAMPRICAALPNLRMLLIGDGNYKHLVDQAIESHGLHDRVRAVGRVPQKEGARLLKACDIYVSPHNSHMIDSKFFGSPTKIFEYMAMAGGIVASDLEQIGQILSPALRPGDLSRPDLPVDNQRAVLCEPGNVDEFVTAVEGLASRLDVARALGQNARAAVVEDYSWARHVEHIWGFLADERTTAAASTTIVTGDKYKDEVQRQWDNDPAGSHYVKEAPQHTIEWFLEAEAYRYGEYAPWMRETMEFERHAGEELLEIGGGMGTDLAQFAKHGAHVTDVDLSSGHLELAKESFRLRGLDGRFVLHDAETLPFPDASFDVVYSNGVLHHTPNTRDVVAEIHRVLKPGGKAIVMMYAENSLHYWRNLLWTIGLKEGQLQDFSMGEIMSRSVERSEHGARPLVKVYTPAGLQKMFRAFADVEIVQRQMIAVEVPRLMKWLSLDRVGSLMGWNLIVKARKPRA